MEQGAGNYLKPYAVKCFRVDYEISYKGGFGSGEESGKHMRYFYVIKEKETSTWLIAEMGV
jgi:hypothetical protein